MCGVFGLVGASKEYNIEKSTKIMNHRGPDDWGIKVLQKGYVCLGHTRLSILDLSPRGHQPMCDIGNRFWITYNGEIYNYKEIKEELMSKGHRFKSKTDTEVILYSYIEWGVGCLDKFNGMFAFAIWDDKKKVLFAARDRIGIKPLYYYYKDKLLIFASEIKAILETNLVKRYIDYSALHTPAMFQISPLTGFKDIYKLPPANYMIFNGDKLRIKHYWKINPSEDYYDEKKAKEKLDNLLNLSITGQMISDVPVGAFLSGGLDSSLIVALMSKNTENEISTFTIKYSKEDQKFEQMPEDSKYAEQVAHLFHCNHHEFEIKPDVTDLLPKMIWHLDEPLADPASINTYLIAKSARENGIVVLLNGMGGDEIFAGYRTQLACLLADTYQTFIPEFGRKIIKTIIKRLPVATSKKGNRLVRWAKRFLTFASLPQIERYFSSGTISPDDFNILFSGNMSRAPDFWDTHYVKSQIKTLNMENISYLTKICLNNTNVFLPEHNLTYSDKCTMAAGVESRPPLTDHKIVEFMFSVPPKLRIKGLTQKYLLKKVAEKYLPKEIIYRPKAPFGAPLRSWIRGPLSEMVNDYLSPASLQKRGIYNSKYVMEKIQNDKNGKEDNALLIWTLLCNEIWINTFFG